MSDAASKKAPKSRGRPFPPGHNGGPGRPAGSRNAATILLDALADGEAAEVLQRVVEAAKGGDMRAAELILARVWAPRKGRPVPFALPSLSSTAADLADALSDVLRAVSDGVLTPDEGQAVAALVEARRKTLELAEIEGRVAALESRVAR